MTRAWWIGRLHHSDPKKYPKRPDLIWNKEADRQTPHTMAAVALAMASNQEEAKAIAASLKMKLN